MGLIAHSRALFKQPAGPFSLNRASAQSRGLLLWVPLTPWSANRDLSTYRYQPALVNGPKFESIGNVRALRLQAASDQFVYIPNALPWLDALASSPTLTVSAWVRFADVAGSYQIISRDDSTLARQFTLDFTPATGFRFYVNGGAAFLITGVYSPVANLTYHVAGVLDAAGGHLFVNGVEVGTAAGSFTLPAAAAGSVQIGRRTFSGAENPLNGWITDARIYRQGLSASGINALYRQKTRFELYRISQGPTVFLPVTAAHRASQLVAELAGRGARTQALSQLVVEVASTAIVPALPIHRLSQVVAEVSSAGERDQRLSQLAIELAWAPPLADGLYINGIEHDPLLATFEIQKSLNELDTLKADFDSHAEPYFRPPLDARLEYREDGRRLFGGFIMGTAESCYWPEALSTASMAVRVDASSHAVLATRRTVSAGFAAGQTLKQYAAALAPLFSPYASFDASMPDGPTLDARVWTNQLLADALQELVTAAADAGDPFYWRINPDGLFGFYRLGEQLAPFDLIEGDPRIVGDIETDLRRTNAYANRVVLPLPASAAVTSSESFHVADGILQANGLIAFFARYQSRASAYDEANGWPNELYFDGVGMGPIEWAPNALTLGVGVSFSWAWDWVNHALVFNPANVVGGVLPTTEQIDITYSVSAVIAEDLVEQSTHGIWEYIAPEYAAPITLAAAQALAEGMLLERMITPVKIRWATFETGLEPGMVQSVTSAKRDLSGAFLIQEVAIRYFSGRAPVGAGDRLIREISATGRASSSAPIPKGRWQEVLKQWSGLAT